MFGAGNLTIFVCLVLKSGALVSWNPQGLSKPVEGSGVPGILFGVGLQQIQLRTEDTENGDLGTVAP